MAAPLNPANLASTGYPSTQASGGYVIPPTGQQSGPATYTSAPVAASQAASGFSFGSAQPFGAAPMENPFAFNAQPQAQPGLQFPAAAFNFQQQPQPEPLFGFNFGVPSTASTTVPSPFASIGSATMAPVAPVQQFGFGAAAAGGGEIKPIVHPGHEPKPEVELVAVIITISSGGSYDELFTQVPQLPGDGKRVAVYRVGTAALAHVLAALGGPSGGRTQPALSTESHQHLRRLVADVDSVDASAVVFNWECCSGCNDGGFCGFTDTVINLVKRVLDRGHMAMFSDFSMKALINDWREDLLGPKPFKKVTEFSHNFKIGFDPQVLAGCPSAQLQKLGELANDGTASLHAMGGTIAFTVDWAKADCQAYQCKVLTVMTEHDGRQVAPTAGQGCETGGHRGLAGHVLLTYPSGGHILASAGHWIELSRLDVTQDNLFAAAAQYGAVFQQEVMSSVGQCVTAEERQRSIQAFSSQMVQQSAPCSYSVQMGGRGGGAFASA